MHRFLAGLKNGRMPYQLMTGPAENTDGIHLTMEAQIRQPFHSFRVRWALQQTILIAELVNNPINAGVDGHGDRKKYR
ncbi:hypothetical protein ACFQ4C_21555 [Larkinella insperata]|uniref:Uncharacterized protein n=1 Tax=Larkinella insperata TaxID=332158 RepID=A0ABW3QL19_9BACT